MNREEMLSRLAAGEDPLELSIKKWQDIREHLRKIHSFQEYDKALEQGSTNCALCEVFCFYGTCSICPVAKKTGPGCTGTPYEAFKYAVLQQDLDAMRKAADEEIKFLESLRGDKEESG